MKSPIKLFLAAAIIFNFEFSIFNSANAQDAEYNLIRRTYTVNSDGTIDIQFRKELKLLRNRAITAYADKGETFILYNPTIDQLTINESYTIRKDGSRVQTPANAFIDQLPSECQDCGRYNGIRERAVIHTALEYDCIIVLDYTIHRKADYLNEKIVLNQDCPVKKYEIIYNEKVPSKERQNRDFNCNNLPKSHKFLKNGDDNVWHLVVNDLPQTYSDSYLPSPAELYANVQINYGNKDDDVESNDEKLPEASNTVAELYDQNQLTYATNIRDYVCDIIRTNEIPMELTGYRTSPARVTFLSGCGTPADKERLLAAMLREAGFKVTREGGAVVADINEEGIEISYRFPLDSRRPPRPDGMAIDEQRTIDITESLEWRGENIGGGYERMTLPVEKGSISIDPARLTSDRKTPVKVRNCNEKYHYTIKLTPGQKLAKTTDIKYSKKGVGSIRVSIKESSGGVIDIVRELDIDVENGIVTEKQYKAFRQLMQDWQSSKRILVNGD